MRGTGWTLPEVRALTLAEVIELFEVWKEAPPVPDLLQAGFGITVKKAEQEYPDHYVTEEEFRAVVSRLGS